MRPIACMVTPPIMPEGVDALVSRIEQAGRAGLDLVQIRQPQLEAGILTDLVRRAVAAAHGTRTRILVNDRLDVALAAGAHGVHLREQSVAAPRIRRVVPRGFLLGRSVHDVDGATNAAGTGVDYLIFGTVYPSPSKPGRVPAGEAALSRVVGAVSLPVLAIGGVTVDRLAGVARAGAAGFAAIGLFAGGTLADILDEAASVWSRR